MERQWFKTSNNEFPPEGKYVLAKHSRGTWNDSDDPEGVNYIVVKLVKGLSLKERAQLPEDDPRKEQFKFGDEWGNNKVPYQWSQFGPDSFFGQNIEKWTYIT